MLNSTTLEVAIGMAFIYLLLSLFCTAINEGIAGILSSRARNLERGLRALFTEGSLPKRDKDGAIVRDDQGKPAAGTPLSEAIYTHGLVQSLFESGSGSGIARWWGGGRRLPSYIPARTFGTALIDLLFPDAAAVLTNEATTPAARLQAMVDRLNDLPDGKAKQALVALVKQANGDIVATRRAVEAWFNDGMDRVSGWYKRKTQLVLFCLGLGIALALNIDSINVARSLWVNPALRAYTITAANRYATDNPIAPKTSAPVLTEPLQRLQDLALPIGWSGGGPLQWIKGEHLPHWSSGQALLFALAGWLLTAIAMTLGAPFWFDTLNQFMVVRSTIKPREKSEVETSKDPTTS
jgi:hypothetical protein